MLLTPAQIKPKPFESRRNSFFTRGGSRASCLHACLGTRLLPQSYQCPNLSEGADRVGVLHCCFTSTEARWLIRDGDRMGRGRQSEGSTAVTARKGPERPWTAARTMEVLRRCPLAIAQRLVHCAVAVSKTMSVALLLTNNLDNSKQRSPTYSAQLHLPTVMISSVLN